MSIITFWSNDNIETGQTMSMAAVATHMAIEHNYKILMIDTANNDKTLEDAFWSQTKKTIVKQKQDIGSGLSGLIRVIDSNRNSPEVITNYSKIIFKNRLELLNGDKMNVEEYKKMQETLQNIVLLANKYYDYVFIDLKTNIENETTKKILSVSDVIVVNITQRLRNINNFLELKEQEDIFKKDNVILNIGTYNPRLSKYTSKNIARYMREKEILFIPYNNTYFEATNEGLVADYFIKFRKVRNVNPNAPFIEATKKLKNAIIDRVKALQMKI